jgi:hypothetical protein
MPVITASVREAIATGLAGETDIDTETADALVIRIASDPRLMLATPQTFPELRRYLEQLGVVLAERDLEIVDDETASELRELFIGEVAHAPFDRYELSAAQRTQLHEAGLDALASPEAGATTAAEASGAEPSPEPDTFEDIAELGLNTRVSELDDTGAITASDIRDIIEEADLKRAQLEALWTYLEKELTDRGDE